MTGKKKMKFAAFLIVIIICFYGVLASNVTINYGWNGSSYVPFLLTSEGKLMTDINKVNLTAGKLIVDTNTLYVDSDSDRVGIGTVSPGGKLEVIGSINATDWTNVTLTQSQISDLQTYALESNLYANSTRVDILVLNQWYNSTQQINDNSSLNLKIDALNLNAYNASNLAFTNISETFDLNLSVTDSLIVSKIIKGAGNFIVDASGNVGIGTLNPSNALEVNGDINISSTSGELYVYGTGNSFIMGDVGIKTDTPANDFNVIGDGNFTGALYVGGVSVNSSANISGGGIANYIVKWADAATIAISNIYDDGTNVGIGTTAPNAGSRLTVAGNITPSANDTYSLGSIDNVWKDIYLGAGSLFLGGKKLWNNLGTLEWDGGLNVGGNLSANGANIASGALFVDNSSSNVGIGTTSPAEKLHVVGNANITGNVLMGYEQVQSACTVGNPTVSCSAGKQVIGAWVKWCAGSTSYAIWVNDVQLTSAQCSRAEGTQNISCQAICARVF